jgi:hypothetical protein
VSTCFDVAVMGSHAYVADYDAGLQVIDVSDPSHCVRVAAELPEAWPWQAITRTWRMVLRDCR